MNYNQFYFNSGNSQLILTLTMAIPAKNDDLKKQMNDVEKLLSLIKNQLNQDESSEENVVGDTEVRADTIVHETVEEEELPENARPFQCLAYNKNKPLSLQEVLGYFKDESKAITKMPDKPSAGEVILFKAKDVQHGDNWRTNGHRWCQANGGR